jgi:hypothetical protein
MLPWIAAAVHDAGVANQYVVVRGIERRKEEEKS